jgi:hypothetical protein
MKPNEHAATLPDSIEGRSHGAGSGRRIGLVGCVKEKRSSMAPACDLYSSALFVGRRRYVESSCDEWWILSALHGLVHPDKVIAPYDLALKNLGRPERRRWSREVVSSIDVLICPRPGDVFEFHAGAEYRDFGVSEALLTRGCIIENPTAHMPIGRQLQFYAGNPG